MDSQEAEKPEIPEAKIVSDLPITVDVEIKFPVEFDGKVYSSITLRRPSAKEVSDYVGNTLEVKKPMPPGVDCPKEVWEAMVDDDQFEVNKRYEADFFPQRLKAWVVSLGENTDTQSVSSLEPSQPQSQP